MSGIKMSYTKRRIKISGIKTSRTEIGGTKSVKEIGGTMVAPPQVKKGMKRNKTGKTKVAAKQMSATKSVHTSSENRSWQDIKRKNK